MVVKGGIYSLILILSYGIMNMQTGAIAEKREREVAVLTTLISLSVLLSLLVSLLISPVSANGVRHLRYSEANASDEAIYSFFTDVLKDAGTCMDKIIEESPDADNLASSLESGVKVTEEESRFYAAKGVESNVSWVVKLFCSLSRGVKKTTSSQLAFLTNYKILKNESDYEAYVRARTAVVNMRAGADAINCSLDAIEQIELWNETSRLFFNVSELRDKLKDIYALIDHYEKLLEKYELETPTFEKIPTFITLSSKYAAFVNERVKITGLLVDYYNEPLCGANVTITASGRRSELKTDRNGRFAFIATRSSEGYLNVSAFYPGNDTYESSSANISLFFLRFPVSLHIEANETQISANETVNFTGSVYGINSGYTVALTIFVNDTRVKTLTGTKDFNFSFRFPSPGTYWVYAFFPGDSQFMSAKSNVVKITVKEKPVIMNPYFYLWLILIAIILFFTGLYARTLKRKTKQKNKTADNPGTEVASGEVEERGEEEAHYEEASEANILEGINLEDAYKLLFDTIVEKYGIKRSATPRELVKAVKEEAPFAEMLEVVTGLYEKAVYGNQELTVEEEESYFKLIKEILSLDGIGG
ncbi:hypothetical protein DRN97_05140 [Methanosarcinales archaeon]|nr:MAG: hypothetical protein DRN97_05140 [Methanosarcinales archaeon]